MQNFIVLGIVPGTQIRLTFTFWLVVASTFVGLLVVLFFLSHVDLREIGRSFGELFQNNRDWEVVA